MKSTIVTFLVLLAIGLYPEYAHRIVNAATELVCNIVPYPNRNGVELIILLVAIVCVARWK
jgi:hypothetical protein